MATTVVRDCDWIVAWVDGAHTYLRGGDVAWQDGVLAQVGGRWQGAADIEISGRGRLVMPGLVDLHSHPSLEPAYRGVREEHGVRGHYMSGLYERSCAFWPDEAGQKAAAEVAYCELLLSGVTALADLSGPYDGWIELMARSGLRGFVAPWFAGARWKLENDHDLQFTWAKDDGRAAFDRALALADEAGRHPSGRLSGVIFPAQIETCSRSLLKDAMAAALARKLPITTHASQSVNEFLEIVKRTGKTPVQYAADLGILHPSMTLAHCIFIDDHSWLHWRTHNDVALLAETGTSIAHCPTPFARYGAMLEDFGRYRRAGINLGVGTDTTPHNMIEEIRWAVILCKTASGDVHGTKLSDVFHAATVGGAKALLRDDIGRLAPGCRADLVLVDIDEPWMQPARDPLRSLVFHAADRAVRDVFVDGTQVVRDRTVLTLDRAAALAQLAEAQARMLEAAPARDYAHRRAEEIAPLTFPVHGH